MTQKHNTETDRKLAQHLVSLYYADDGQHAAQRRRAGNVDQEFLRDFILYARTHVAPEVTDEAVEGLVQGYLSMRSMGGRGSKTITATTRQLESLIRLAQVRIDVGVGVEIDTDVYID